jgi:hypothetical protein
MRIINIRSFLAAALGFLALAGAAGAQDKAQVLLSTIEVRQLVERAQPADHVRLGAHFAALGDRFAAEAKRHTSMSQGFIGNPSRNLGTGMSVHCKRLAELNTQSATTVRELAAHHRQLAAGAASTPPTNAGRFDAGAGAPEPTEQKLTALASAAKTPGDHRELEAYFGEVAKRYSSDAAAHRATAQAYRGLPRGQMAAAAVHCDRLETLSLEAAKEAAAAAAMHKEHAGAAR